MEGTIFWFALVLGVALVPVGWLVGKRLALRRHEREEALRREDEEFEGKLRKMEEGNGRVYSRRVAEDMGLFPKKQR